MDRKLLFLINRLRGLGDPAGAWHIPRMPTVTIALSDELDAALAQTMEIEGVQSKEDYLLRLVEERCAQSELDRVLLKRLEGPFTPFEADWKEQVRLKARELNAP